MYFALSICPIPCTRKPCLLNWIRGILQLENIFWPLSRALNDPNMLVHWRLFVKRLHYVLTMSRSEAKSVATSSYGETQWPEVDVHALLTITPVPSRLRTASRVSHPLTRFGIIIRVCWYLTLLTRVPCLEKRSGIGWGVWLISDRELTQVRTSSCSINRFRKRTDYDRSSNSSCDSADKNQGQNKHTVE